MSFFLAGRSSIHHRVTGFGGYAGNIWCLDLGTRDYRGCALVGCRTCRRLDGLSSLWWLLDRLARQGVHLHGGGSLHKYRAVLFEELNPGVREPVVFILVIDFNYLPRSLGHQFRWLGEQGHENVEQFHLPLLLQFCRRRKNGFG